MWCSILRRIVPGPPDASVPFGQLQHVVVPQVRLVVRRPVHAVAGLQIQVPALLLVPVVGCR